MTSELKPCPFCGENNEPTETEGETDKFYIRCDNNDCGIWGPERDSEAEAIAAWNTRVPDPAAQKVVEALEACEHKIDQHLQGQYLGGEALGIALQNARSALATWYDSHPKGLEGK